MRARALVHLATLNLRADRRGALLNAGAACVGAAALVFFLALGMGVGQAARRMFPGDARLSRSSPPRSRSAGRSAAASSTTPAWRASPPSPGWKGRGAALSLRVPVAASRPPEGVRVNWPPGFTVQIPVVGVDPGLLEGDVARGFRFEDPPAGRAVPVMASRRLLEVYNKTIAPAWNLRRLPPGMDLVGLEFPVRVGFSIIPQKTEDRVSDERLVLVGLSDRVPLYSLAVPVETVRRLHREYGKADQGYTGVTLQVGPARRRPVGGRGGASHGLRGRRGRAGAAERVGLAIAVTAGALVVLALLMTGLAALAIAQSLSASVRGRTREIAILEALGATGGDVRALVLAEAALVGLAGGAVGVVAARLAALGADRAALHFLPDFPFRPETFFSFPAWLLALGVGVSLAAAVVGALAPAALAARVDPARSVS